MKRINTIPFGASLLLWLLISAVLAASAFTPQSQPTGWITRHALTSYDLSSNNESVFRADFFPSDWTGNISAFHVSSSGTIQSSTPWTLGNANDEIATQNFDTGRNIVTVNGSGTAIPFRWASLSSSQQTAIGNSTTGPAILNYVRGDRANESPSGAKYRVRSHIIGDIEHSSLLYWDHGSNTTRLYVGDNGGMLHVLDASTGLEVFAYVPSMVIPNLNKLVVTPYTHTFFVDGPMSMANVTISGALKTILVGGLGAGGKGLYALDVTTPTAADETAAKAKIKWEISATGDYANLGYTYAMPTIVRLNDGTPAVIVGNGYMNSGNYRASLYVINLADGTLLKEIDTGSGDSTSPNGLSSPTPVDTNRDGKVDYVYAGDLNGNVWKFDLTSTTTSSFSKTLLFTTSPVSPVTVAPAVYPHPNGGDMVMFGTGKMLDPADKSDTTVHYVYGIWDGAPVSNTTLVSQSFTETTTSAGKRVRYATSATAAPNWASTHDKGWKLTLPAGERVLGEAPFFADGRYYFTSTNPTINLSALPSGENWLNEVNYLTGGNVSASIFDMNNDNAVNTGDLVNSRVIISKQISSNSGVTAGVSSQPVLVDLLILNNTFFNTNDDNAVTVDIPVESRGVAGGHFDVDIYYGPSPTKLCTYTTSGGSAGTKASGSIKFSYSGSKSISALSLKIGTVEIITSTTAGSVDKKGLSNWIAAHYSSANYTVTSNNKDTVTIDAKNVGTAYNATLSISASGLATSDRTITNVSGGADAVAATETLSSCQSKKHTHEYDDIYDVTGVNMLAASDSAFNLANAIPSTSTSFKVIAQNQYLSPAVKIGIGGNAYTAVKNFATSATLTVASLPTYTRSNISSLVYNMPVDAFAQKDWWGNGDVRVGLHPTQTGCVKKSTAAQGGNLYQPVVPPANGTEGPGTNSTTAGARHNGALVFQVIKDTTPDSALELNVPSRPEYGWRVKSADYETYVLAEYTTFWHHPNGKCYGDTGWVKAAPEDTSASSATAQTPAVGSSDPKDGTFGSSGGADSGYVSKVTTTSGNTTTDVYTYSDGTTYKVVTTVTATKVTTVITSRTGVVTTTIDNLGGDDGTGGQQTGSGSGRITWREVVLQ